MTTLRKVELESIFLISIVAAVSMFFVVQRNSQGQFSGSDMRIATINSPLPTPAPEQKAFSQISPDGTKKVVMRVTQNLDNTSTYDFSAADENGANEQSIFTKTLGSPKSMTVPLNTFSPDNKYFFVQENAGDNKKIFAFQTSGEPFSGEEQYFDVTDLFRKKETGNNFDEATGWASESLIIINTKKEDGSKGPSYWFEVPSKAILILATEF
ncbi:MAG: hypothetical protein HYW62_01005 [Candidatus Levybacteria bacterium]|nr:hypothetical protein [Candidatus Levybacteria bacterium]